MPLTKVSLRPGIVRETTDYSNEGGYNYCNLARFRFGFAEKLGGWATAFTSETYNGVATSLINWETLNNQNLIGFGTTQQYYVFNTSDPTSGFHDITPLFKQSTLTNQFTTVAAGSPVVTVNTVNHQLAVGQRVYYSPVAGPATSVTVDGATVTFGMQTTPGDTSYRVINVVDVDNYQIIADSNAIVGGVTGGGNVNAMALINCNSSESLIQYGWGIGTWGYGTWGVGQGSPLNYDKRLWSQANFGQDLIFAIQGGPIYYWVKDTVGYTPAITLAEYACTQQYQTITTVGAAAGLTFTVQFNDYVYPGECISFNGAPPPGGFIPPDTYIVSVVGLTVTVNNPVTLPNGSVLNVSYSGQYVPNETNKIFVSPIYQFTIALGANPYDPTNPLTQFNPLLVRWSDQTVPAQWIPLPSNQSGEQTLGNGSRLVTAVNNYQQILVFTDTSLYSMQYIGAPYVFSFTLMQDSISIISQNAALTANSVTWWMGVDKFYTFNGSVSALPCSLRRYVFNDLNYDQAWKIVSGYNEGFSEVWWMYPSKNSEVNDRYVIFNFADNVWSYGSLFRTAWLDSALLPHPMAMTGVDGSYLATSDGLVTLADASTYPAAGYVRIGPEITQYDGKILNTLTLNGVPCTTAMPQYTQVGYIVPNQIMFHEYGVDDNTIPNVTLPVPGFIQTSDMDAEDGHHFMSVWRMVPDLTFTNSTAANPKVTLTLYPKQNSGSAYQTPVDQPTVTESVAYPVEQYTGQVYTRVRGRQFAFRVDTGDPNDPNRIYGLPVSAIGTMWQLGTMRFDMRPDGRR